MSLFWRIFLLNALVFGAALASLLLAPVTVSVPVLLTEASVLVGGLLVMLVADAALLHVGLAPLGRLTGLMATVDLLRPGQRLPVTGQGDVPELIRTFNEMLDRLEAERGDSNARALSAQEAERRRIAQELHDEVGQSMTAVLLELKRVADRAPEHLRSELRHVQEATRESLDEVRRIARRLRPGVLEDLGLVSALTALTTDYATHTGLTVRRSLASDLPPLGQDTELVLYRVAQESLTNVARHSGASQVWLTLEHGTTGTSADRAGRGREHVVLTVRDDGSGLGRSHEGAGIRGIRERALLVGGDLRIWSEAGAAGQSSAGTTVRLAVPVDTVGDERKEEGEG
ncbi:HAMP domain-containing sensor histidine kinase [Streptomyces sp. TP-A0874]|uniref:HAMP domain-containing sensor histidine kinase n=1 Tax=Streptomyces sp. TP-A0874 TaxID=549819 RepID=UPI000852DA91|nr:HAMP domain-containing sensor histidine kinase [Streptomyces sp. TP-A0874]